jgi:uncharacterized protein YkwD
MSTIAARSAITAARLARVIAVVAALAVMPSAGVALAAGHRAAASSAACDDTHLVPTRANSTRVEAATLCLVNIQRARHGVRALRQNADLARSSAAHSEDMVARNYFDHVSPGGETPLERIRKSSYLPSRAAYVIGENIAFGTMQLATAAAIVTSWMKSPGHRANILNPDFRDSGIGVVARAPSRYAQGQRGATYTQQFGAVVKR